MGSTVSNQYHFNGYIEQFAYSNSKFTDTEIKYLYTQGLSSNINYNYDAIGRVKTSTIDTGKAQFSTSYSFEAGKTTGSTTNRVISMKNGTSEIKYTYDANGNIETITDVTLNKSIKYTYNELNEVKREDNGILNKSIVYSYDAGGNILNKVEYPYTTGTLGTATATINYGYGDTNWKDKLTSYNNKPITYDAIGNPLTYDGYTYTWEMGRRLKGIAGNGKTISYKYNDAGIRTEKTVNGVTTKYTLNGDSVIYEDNGTDKIHYSYSGGNLVSLNLNDTEYYYVRNAQGDIIGLIDGSGAQVVKYTYDTWGKLLSIEGSLKDSVGVKNPYRYRGYRYDNETGLYYLNSRYYSPERGRFINADGIVGQTGEMLGHNLFMYCKNNPVNMHDSNGFRPDVNGGMGRETQAEVEASLAAMSEVNYNNYIKKQQKAAVKKLAVSAGMNTLSGGLNLAATKVTALSPYKFKTLSKFGYMFGEKPISDSIKGWSGKVGYASIALGFANCWDDLSKREYFSAGIDAGAVVVGGLVGLGIEAVGAFAIATFGLPALAVGAGVFTVGVISGVVIDSLAGEIKRKHYRRL